MAANLFEIEDELPVLRVHVQPGAGRSMIAGRHGDALKVRVAAPPERGRANEACAELLAEALGLKTAQVRLIAGEASRTKRFAVDGIEPDDLARRLERLVGEAPGRPGGARPDIHRY